MYSLIQNSVRSDVQSIENSHFNDQFSKQIQALLEYGMYEYAFNRVSQHKEQILGDYDLLIDLTRKFNKFKQHKYALQILKFTNIFEKQLDLPQNIQQIIFKQYFLETLIEIEDVITVLSETKQIFDDQIRNMIQDDLHQLQNQRKGSIHSQNHQNLHSHPQLEIQIPKKQKYKIYKKYPYLLILIALILMGIWKKDKVKRLIVSLILKN